MNWNSFKTYDLGEREAFETLNNQLFERYLRRNYGDKVTRFRVVNGSGGDGGVEAYAEMDSSNVIAVQSKYFRQALKANEIKQIKDSILTAKKVRLNLKEYIICIPRNLSSIKFTKGNKLTKEPEEKKVQALVDEIKKVYPDLMLTWWFDNELVKEIQQPDNEGVHKYWFEKQVISLTYLKDQFALQKQNEWLKERYIPILHTAGIIEEQYEEMIFSQSARKKLFTSIQEAANMIIRCRGLISRFLETNEYSKPIKTGVEHISNNLQEYLNEMILMQDALRNGNERFRAKTVAEYEIYPTSLALEQMPQTHVQKSIVPKLISLLTNLHSYKLPDYLAKLNADFTQIIKLITGSAGTGKTHALANCVMRHLNTNQPAIIIQAKSTLCQNWTQILSSALELPGWTKEELFSSLESVAISNDIRRVKSPAADPFPEESKVLICVDGLEEVIAMQSEWCSRMAETTLLAEKYPRVRFLFSARDYFPKNCIDVYNPLYEYVELPMEGNVDVWTVKNAYFKYYKITIENQGSLKGLNSLLALRLFCEEYQGRTIKTGEQVLTATRDLLNLKVNKINQEFLNSLQNRKGVTQKPVSDALILIAELFYDKAEILHDKLKATLMAEIGDVLDTNEVDIMLDYFVQHAILIRINKKDESGVLTKTIISYRITYQTIIEHILSEKIYLDIRKEKIKSIPDILHKGIARHPSADPSKMYFIAPNEQIIQSIVNRLFVETKQLIGENGYLTEGFKENEILKLKYRAIAAAPYKIAIAYKAEIDKLCWDDYMSQYYVLKYLVLPSANRSGKAFGSEYVHTVLINQTSAFERDKIWSGLDSFEQPKVPKNFRNNVKLVLDEYDSVYFSEYENFDEAPLLHAWALSNINQKFRNKVRIALAGWAKNRPEEFRKLLDKFVECNDPQIMEDLSSIALGLASVLEEATAIKPIADWALLNIFNDIEQHRNIVVRQGFRAIVEKAFLIGAISEEDVKIARPQSLPLPANLLPLASITPSRDSDETYPIVHDLAWYVIKKAYREFLAYPTSGERSLKDNDCKEGKALLDLYRIKYEAKIFGHTWTMRAAIAYMRESLGLDRTKGNSYTDATHGSKSAIFTYEEKYTWLAVHFIQGYLSDYVPMEEGSKRQWVDDYSKLIDMPNPVENAIDIDEVHLSLSPNEKWMIKENLAPTVMLTGDIGKNIKDWVGEEPKIDFSKWLKFEDSDFPGNGDGKTWLALHSDTSLDDATKVGISRMESTACLIPVKHFEKLKRKVQDDPDSLGFITSLDRLEASPDTDTYSNPSDLVWMKWVGEVENSEMIYFKGKEVKMDLAITRVVQRTLDGEKYYRIPSKMIRELIGARTYADPKLYNGAKEVIAFRNAVSDGAYRDSQELVLVDEELLAKVLKENSLKLIWWVDFFKAKDALNKQYEKYLFVQKSSKYFVWQEGDQFKSYKFWSEYFSNTRDKARPRKQRAKP